MNIEWRPIKNLDWTVEKRLRGDLAALDALHRNWNEFADRLDKTHLDTLMRRTLRRHAIETGILERLYQIDWGVTETLVAEGFAREAIVRAGGELSPGVVRMLESQMEGLHMVSEYVREGFPLTTSFVKELHALITRDQKTYEATDALGRSVQAALTHGKFKTLRNNVMRADGSLLEFTPPEQVNGEMEKLVKWHNEMDNVHPVVSAAWLHHRFVQIHPFQDGNGRVARALTLLSLGSSQYPPMVVDRDSRDSYLNALDKANDGELVPLGKLFIKLAMRSIRRELEYPIPGRLPQTAIEVARAFAQSLERQQLEEEKQQELAVQIRAGQLLGRIEDWLQNSGTDLEEVFAYAERKVWARTEKVGPNDSRAKWWRQQIIGTATKAEHYADLSSNSWWAMLRVTVNGLRLRFVTSIHHAKFVKSDHHVGSRRTGVMAITSFGDIRIPDEEPSNQKATFVETSLDAFYFSHDEEVENRSDELYEWLDQSLAVALQELKSRALGG